MNPTINDWASVDPTQNITLEDASRFQNQLASALAIQFGEIFVQSTDGEIIALDQVRRDPNRATTAANFQGTLAGVSAATVNVAALRTQLRDAAASDDPTATLEAILRQALPQSDFQSIILRAPGIQAAVKAAIAQID